MKKFFSILAVALLFCTSLFADENPVNAFRLTLRGADVRDVLFVSSPRISYSQDGTELTINLSGGETATYKLSDVERMTFVYCDPAAIQDVLIDSEEQDQDKSIYTLDGRKVDSITTRGTYIVGGRKVLIK